VKLAHGRVLQDYEGRDILVDTRCYIWVIEVDWSVPEVLQLFLPFLDVFRENKVLKVCLIFILILVNIVELGNLELFMVGKCNVRLQKLSFTSHTNFNLLIESFRDIFSKSKAIKSLQIMLN
jgi:hypothetical protein